MLSSTSSRNAGGSARISLSLTPAKRPWRPLPLPLVAAATGGYLGCAWGGSALSTDRLGSTTTYFHPNDGL